MALLTSGRLPRPSHWRALFLLLLWYSAVIPAAQLRTALEYRVKAGFLYNFAKFVDWPPAPAGTPLCICIWGTDPFGPILDEALRGKVVNKRSIVIRRIQKKPDRGRCDMMFIGAANWTLPEMLDAANADGSVTIAEQAGYARRGVMINLVPNGDTLRFEINLEAARRAGVHFSSQLLELATIVEPAKDQGP